MSKKSNLAVIPVLASFFIMGFADVVGISSSYVKQDFGLSDTMANLLPMMVFLWFAIFAVPTGIMMNKFGRKNTVLLSIAITLAALLVPLIAYSYSMVLVAFALLGISNTILQVSLNPLLTNVVKGEKLTSSLTLGQFVKAIASFLGPIIAGVASGTFGNWKLIFPVFAALTLLSGLWLLISPVEREKTNSATTGFAASFSLMKDPVIRLHFWAIVVLVGIDVGLNTTLPKFLMEKTSLSLEQAGLATSLYFAARTIGTFAGAFLLMKLAGRKFFIGSAVLGIFGVVMMLLFSPMWVIWSMIFCLGLAIANIFPIVFSSALQKEPQRANEVSGLLIMGVAGGAVVPPVMGLVSDATGQSGAMIVLLLCFVFLLYSSLRLNRS